MAHHYKVVRIVDDVNELENQVKASLDEGWRLAGGIAVSTTIVMDQAGSPVPTLVYLQAMSKEE